MPHIRMLGVTLIILTTLVTMIALSEYRIYPFPLWVILGTQGFLYFFIVMWAVLSFKWSKE